MEKGGRNAKKSSSSSSSTSARSMTIEQFVSKMTPLLDMEKVALLCVSTPCILILSRNPLILFHTLFDFFSHVFDTPLGLQLNKTDTLSS